MEKNPTWIAVVALALFDQSGRVLLQQRPERSHHGGLWEFPGGKVESKENPKAALVREIAEELAIALDPEQLEPAGFAEEVGDHEIVLLLYTSRQIGVSPAAQDGQEWGWFTLPEAAQLSLAPMDCTLLGQIAPVAP